MMTVWQGGQTIPGCQVSDTIIGEAMGLSVQAVRWADVLKHLGVKYITPAPLPSGTLDSQELPDKVLIQDCVWPPGTSYASIAIHSGIHLEQIRHPWGGLGLEVMAYTAELLFHLSLDHAIGGDNQRLRTVMAQLDRFLDLIRQNEIRLLEGAK